MNKWTIEKLRELHPCEFEELVGNLFSRMGYRAEVTPYSKDNGVDIIISIEKFGLSHTWIVQTKRYIEPVSVKEVREYSSLRYRDNVDGVIIVTTSSFTKEAQKEAGEHNVKLIDGQLLLKMLQHYMPEDSDRRLQQGNASEKRETEVIEGTVLKQGEKILGETEVFLRGERVLMACTTKRIFLIKNMSGFILKKKELIESIEVKDILGWAHEKTSLHLVTGGRQLRVVSMKIRKMEHTMEILNCLQQGCIRAEHLLKLERTKEEFILLTNKRMAKIYSSGDADEISLKNIICIEIKRGILGKSRLVIKGSMKENDRFEFNCGDTLMWKEAIEAAVRVS
ncbi:MAG: restriction endonuclease [Methanomethylovorans sp.]|jgi:restriction system protein|nr:restriction endonuclease [Methanomethylovorans sp.]